MYISLRHQLKYKTEFNWVKLCYLQVCIFTAPLISLRLGFRRIFSSVNVFGILTSTRLLPPWLCYNQSYLIDKKMLSLKWNLLTLILNFEKKKLSQTKQDQYHVWTCVAAKHSKFSRKDQMTKLQLYFSYGQHQYLYKHCAKFE